MSASQRRIRIGTRGSALARWQAEHVAGALGALPGAPATELVLIKTEGDRIRDVPLSLLQGKAFFTKEIEDALLNDDVDVAVHSLKDLATVMPPGLTLGAVLERADPRDALLVRPFLRGVGGPFSPEALPHGATVGTSSLRRRALLRRWRADLKVKDLRGNVPTRIRKLDEGEYDAIVLASAGIERLGLGARISAHLPIETFPPAVSQGAVAVQIRIGDEATAAFVGKLDHLETRLATKGERAFLRRLEGGCQIPVGALGTVEASRLVLRGIVCSLDGRLGVEGEISGPAEDAERLGTDLAEELLGKGAGEILGKIRNSLTNPGVGEDPDGG